MSQRPNIIFLFSDQQRWDTLGCYGQKLPLTPELDKMAASGVRIENAFTCQPVCGPARACLQTGKYATEVGCHKNHRMLPTDEVTLAKCFDNAGYNTAYIGKWHLASFGPKDGPDCFRISAVPEERRGGYDYWLAADALEWTSHGYDGHMFDGDGNKREFPEGRYRVDAQTDWVLDYLDGRDEEKPFFLFVSYLEPHHQNDRNCYEGPHGSKEKFSEYETPGDLEGLEGDWKSEYPDYLGCVHSLDGNVKRVFDKLEELGIIENTLVVYTSDHGSHFRTRNNEYKRSCHDASIRIPMLLRGPGFSEAAVIKDLVSLIDLPPTLLRAADIEVPDGMKGRPLQDLVIGGVEDWNKEVFFQISESQCGRGIRTERWKYSVRAPGEEMEKVAFSDVYMEDFLYDLEADPYERNNLIADPAFAELREELRQRLLKRMEQAGEPLSQIVAFEE